MVKHLGEVRYPLSKTKAVVGVCFAWVLISSFFYLHTFDQIVLMMSMGGPSVQQSDHNENSLNWINFYVFSQRTLSSPEDQVKNCVIPKLKENDPVMVKSFKKREPPKCTDEEWLYVVNGTVRFSPAALQKHKRITCDYYPVSREGDFVIDYGNPVKNISDGFKMVSDFFKGVCRSLTRNETNLSIYSGIHYSEDRAKRSDNADPLSLGFQGMSIAILGFDSMSRMSWHRRLKDTRKYFKDDLGAIELESHNIVGDGTTAVMFPMLTGKFEWELPECR